MFHEQGSDAAVIVLASDREQMPMAAEYSRVVVADDIEVAIKLIASKDLGRFVKPEQVVLCDSRASSNVAAAQKRQADLGLQGPRIFGDHVCVGGGRIVSGSCRAHVRI